ncbi:MAG: ComEC family competence protein [Flavobacterium sp.]|uniref:ComEC/Rec2 family competence protein n=1 Tax=Flavobacterium sp. TaxID=239 RepID=UPI0012215FF9|nr:ComEC/Rec2 family competence protein [Flavobacterium sp.]RZJ66709.1 MAG: ComEC family competence protein [Flavobacterium sp.]
MKLLRFPLARITSFFILGIIIQSQFQFGLRAVLFVVCFSGALLLTTLLLRSKSKSFVFGALSFAMSTSLGSFCLLAHVAIFNESHFSHHIKNTETSSLLELRVLEKLKTTDYYKRYICEVSSVDSVKVSGKILLNSTRQKGRKHLAVGSNIIVFGKIADHKKPLNPNQFDYGKYLTNKNIFAQVRTESFIIVGATKDIFYYSDRLRQRVLSNLRVAGFQEKELQVFAALLLGQQQEIDPEILRDYQFAGAVHILSVSGLHVGFVLLILNLFLDYLPRTKRWSLIKLSIVILGLWGFAILAGLAPSVVRSVVMFSFVALGMHLRRSTNVFHTLLVSMLLILIFRPGFLFDVGFQLSYVAVFFILWLQPILDRFVTFDNKIARYFWNIVTVSFAAQIGTFPLSLYYFHQFPGLFFVTNLVVIPLLSLIMALGLAVAAWAMMASVPKIMAYCLQQSISILDDVIAAIARFEQFVFRDVAFTLPMLFVSYALIIAAIFWMKKPSFNKLAIAVLLLLLFQLTFVFQNWSAKTEREWIVFHSQKNTVIACRNGEKTSVRSRDSISEKSFEFTLRPYLTANFSSVEKSDSLENFEYFAGKTIFISDSSAVFPNNVSADIILLSQSPKINLERILTSHKPQLIIVDASNYRNDIERWKATCLKQKIPFHATAEKGFYRLKELP